MPVPSRVVAAGTGGVGAARHPSGPEESSEGSKRLGRHHKEVADGPHSDHLGRRRSGSTGRCRSTGRQALPAQPVRTPAGALRTRVRTQRVPGWRSRGRRGRAHRTPGKTPRARHPGSAARRAHPVPRVLGRPSSATSSTTLPGHCTTPTLVVDIMRLRGYPVDDFDRRADDISVDHPDVVHHYRQARHVHDASADRSVDTERQRRALTSYRLLTEALLGRARNGRSTDRTTQPHDPHRNSDHPASDTRPNQERSR